MDIMSGPAMIILVIGIFYFILFRPQQKKMKKHQNMLNSLKKGDQVVTEGGIHGTVAGVYLCSGVMPMVGFPNI